MLTGAAVSQSQCRRRGASGDVGPKEAARAPLDHHGRYALGPQTLGSHPLAHIEWRRHPRRRGYECPPAPLTLALSVHGRLARRRAFTTGGSGGASCRNLGSSKAPTRALRDVSLTSNASDLPCRSALPAPPNSLRLNA